MAGLRPWAARIASVALAGACCAFAAAGEPQPGTFSSAARCPSQVSWQDLRYEAWKFLMNATATMEVEQVPLEEARGNLETAPEGKPLPLPSSCLAKIMITTQMPLGGGEEVTVWIDPVSAAAQQYEKLKTGHAAYHKIGRYTRNGYYLWRTSPATPYEETHPPADWTHHKSHYSSWGGDLPTGGVVTDPYALLYLVSATSLGRSSKEVRTYVFADDHLVELAFTAAATETVDVDFSERWPGGSRHRSGPMEARVVRVSAKAVATEGQSGAVDLGFLGMRGTMSILLEPGTGVPVEIKGNVEHLGELSARLQEARLRAQPGD